MLHLGRVLRRWRVNEEIDLRTAAKQMGVRSASTLLRIEQGKSPNVQSLRAILIWLMTDADKKGER